MNCVFILSPSSFVLALRAAASTPPLCAVWFLSMALEIKEADWRLFRQLHKAALERFCERVLTDVRSAAADAGDSYHERYLEVFALIRDRDKAIASMFNDVRRSNALILLANIKQ